MLPAHNSKIAIYLLMQSNLLGIVKTGGVYRLFCFDDLRIDPAVMDIYGSEWGLSFEDFADEARVFNHDAIPEFSDFYPQSANQMMIEAIYRLSSKIEVSTLATLVKTFKPVQHGKISKE
jgi:hypothetical protein